MPAIIVTKGAELGEFFPLSAGANIVGRFPGLAVHLHDRTVSRRHLRIEWEVSSATFQVEDLGSTHGVKLNGLRITQPLEISEGDSLTVGSMHFVFTTRNIANRDEAFAVLEEQEADLATLNFTSSAVRAMEEAAGASTRDSNRFRRWAGADRATLAIVFTDVVASTEMTSELGNEAMDRKRRAHFARVRELVRENDGYEIKSSGDGFLLAFHAAVPAVDFALGLTRDPGERTLVVRAGAHIGPVVVEDEDVQGAAVAYAARVVDKAKDGGLWISDEVKGHLDQEKAARHVGLEFRPMQDIELKGFPGTQDLWVVSGRVGQD